jgi:hypothetical protein
VEAQDGAVADQAAAASGDAAGQALPHRGQGADADDDGIGAGTEGDGDLYQFFRLSWYWL